MKRRHGNTKLNEEAVQQIREAYELGATQASLAREWEMSVVQIGRIVRGESWGKVRQVMSVEETNATLKRLMAVQADVAKYGPQVAQVKERPGPLMHTPPEILKKARELGATSIKEPVEIKPEVLDEIEGEPDAGY